MKVEYPAQITQDEDGIFFVAFPDIEEAAAQGETLEKALLDASEVLTLTLKHRLDKGVEVPESSRMTGGDIYMVSPDMKVQVALLIHKEQKGRSLRDFAKTLKTLWP